MKDLLKDLLEYKFFLTFLILTIVATTIHSKMLDNKGPDAGLEAFYTFFIGLFISGIGLALDAHYIRKNKHK